ncbi:hypothetical protein DL764_003840 [Monosporascus ibericus]|uniref:2,6-dihydroxypyridine 3-monooxygenase substrate binding domain-containing protein n=1 Tax=Monosporascus ibericus TaxID=155417 RepID=A0A4Q4TF21_9PEZI|nr:hypothetical protein DL764_003840 [Monosporascus ibericus]
MLADVLIGADRSSSTVRNLLCLEVKRVYAGYCALRGTVPEQEASEDVREAFCEGFTFFHGPGVQILTYLIPGKNGTVEPGERLINFVYYTNFPEGSPELDEIMTKTKVIARERLPPQFAEVVCGNKKPFVQCVMDNISPDHEFMGGKVVLIGDSLAGFRPHTVASTSQAAFDAMIYADYISGKVTREEWKKQTMGYARYIQKRGVETGERSQHQSSPLEELIHDCDVVSIPRIKKSTLNGRPPYDEYRLIIDKVS